MIDSATALVARIENRPNRRRMVWALILGFVALSLTLGWVGDTEVRKALIEAWKWVMAPTVIAYFAAKAAASRGLAREAERPALAPASAPAPGTTAAAVGRP